MTAPMRSTPRTSAIPASQNTAPVNEFRCLFTPDVRKKQKKWQDGFLKFHTFNSRVMVYDTARNFIGETFWKESNALHEGDELNLDKPVMVQVEDPIGITHTDLTPLLEKKTKESPQGKVAPRKLTRPPAPAPAHNVPRTGSQLRHKSLNTLLGTPRGPIGKAITMRSPYETRMEKENEWAAERTAKRQKTTHSSVDLTSSSPVRAGNTTVNKALPVGARTSYANKAAVPTSPVPKAPASATLESDHGHTSSNITTPSTFTTIERSALKPRLSAQEQPLGQITPKPPRAKIRLPKPVETPRPPPPPSSPPVSASNRICNVDFAVQPAIQPAKKPTNQVAKQRSSEPSVQPAKQPTKQPSPPASLERERKAKALRLSTGSKRRTLLCQAGPQQRAKTPNEAPKAVTKLQKQKEVPVSVPDPCDVDVFPWPSDDEESLAQTGSKSSNPPSVSPKEKRKTPPVIKRTIVPKKRRTREPSPQSSPDAFEDMETIQGRMDAQLLVATLSPAPDRSTTSKPPPLYEAKSQRVPKSKKVKALAPKKASLQQTRTRELSPAFVSVSEVDKLQPVAQKNPQEKGTTRSVAAVTIAPKQASLEPERTPSLSLSPNKIALLSTGGFRKKSKAVKSTNSAAAVSTTPTNPPPAPRQISVPLPPHPLRANKAGPLMSTTELSARLKKPPKKRKVEDDPIDDGTQEAHGSKRGLKRVRSENDVEGPIPSTSDLWEVLNLGSGEKGPGNTNSEPNNPSAGASAAKPTKKPSGLAALCGKTDPRKRFARTASLNLNTNVGATELPEGLGSVSPLEKVDTDTGPWSTEAFDLFDWRPPGREGKDKGEDFGIGMLVDG